MRSIKQKSSFGNFLDRVRGSDIVKKLRDQDDFETAASVEMFNRDILDDATLYSLSDEMLGKARRRVINPDNHFIFDFENEEDAVLFKLKFAGAI
tara:strand:+ start:557 stop:841 length:285 start_codon:yes stop_codon:yes gene_type:complete